MVIKYDLIDNSCGLHFTVSHLLHFEEIGGTRLPWPLSAWQSRGLKYRDYRCSLVFFNMWQQRCFFLVSSRSCTCIRVHMSNSSVLLCKLLSLVPLNVCVQGLAPMFSLESLKLMISSKKYCCAMLMVWLDLARNIRDVSRFPFLQKWKNLMT